MTSTPPAQAAAPQSQSRRWPLILVIATTVLAVGGAAAYLALRSASYEASTDVLVAPLASEDPNFQGMPLIRESSDGSRPVQTAAGLLSGTSVAKQAASRLGGEWTTAKVESEVAVVPRGESNLVAIVATSDDPAEAAEVANSYAKAALDHRRKALKPYFEREIAILTGEPKSAEALKQLRAAEGEGDPTLSLATRAEEPTAESGPGKNLVLIIAVIVGLLVGGGAVLVVGVARTPDPPRSA
jgi:capsular polysaccharide biosynthesis protein